MAIKTTITKPYNIIQKTYAAKNIFVRKKTCYSHMHACTDTMYYTIWIGLKVCTMSNVGVDGIFSK